MGHLLPGPVHANVVTNGDFETGQISPWSCSLAQCDVTENFLAVTQRTAKWSGPRQLIDIEGFNSNEDLKVEFNFSIKSSEKITATWKVKVTKADETNYFVIYAGDIDNQDWENVFTPLTLPNFILGSDEVQFYLEVTPAETDYSLDNISLGAADVGDWEEEANQRIDALRKRNVNINFNLDSSVIIEDLVLEIEQKSHNFPFGTAVKSTRIADCYDANADDKYCEFVRDNFNWLVDTYR